MRHRQDHGTDFPVAALLDGQTAVIIAVQLLTELGHPDAELPARIGWAPGVGVFH